MLQVASSSSGITLKSSSSKYYIATGAPALRSALLTCNASKGFGKTKPKSADDEDVGPKSRMRRVKRQMSNTVPSQEQKEFMSGQAFQGAMDVQKRVVQDEENEEFTARLQALKQQAAEKKKVTATAPATGSATASSANNNMAAFDKELEGVYANPPSIQQTLMSQLNSDVSDPKLRDAQLGPNQLAIAGGAIIFGLVFVLVSGADFSSNNRYKGVRSTQGPPDSIQQGIIKTRISGLEDDLRQTPNDPEALQVLGLSYAQLLQYDKAANTIEKLTKIQPNNPDAWRLLGETTLLAEQSQRSVKAYEKAVSLRNDDLQIATGMTDSYIANGQYSKAVSYLEELRTRAPYVSALGAVAKDAPPEVLESLKAGNADADATASSTRDEGSSSSSSSRKAPIRPLEPVSVELLLAKTYSCWRGHDSDALAVYDAAIERFPEDFRIYLAKGVFLRDKGRRADAERMFLQAKFYAPENRQRFVKDTAETKPIVDLPENN